MNRFSIKRASAFFLLVQCLFVTNIAQADVYDELMNKSGMADAMDSFPASVKQGIQQASQQDPNGANATVGLMMKSADDAFEAGKLKAAVVAEVRKSLSAQQAQELLKWYNSDIGKELVMAEKKGQSPQAQMEMQQNAQQLLSDQKRLAMVKKIDEILGMTDFVMNMQVNVGTAMYYGMMSVAKPDGVPELSVLKEQMKANMAPMKGNVQSMMYLNLIYSYKDIAEEKMNKYIDFLSTDTNHQFTVAVLKGMDSGINAAAKGWGTKLAVMVKQAKAANAQK